MPTSIVIVSCLGDFYGKVREVLAQSYIDRIEKAGPVPLIETRTAEEARLIIAKRLQQEAQRRRRRSRRSTSARSSSRSSAACRPGASWSWPRPACASRRAMRPSGPQEKPGFISTLAAALGFGGAEEPTTPPTRPQIEFRELWERFTAAVEAGDPGRRSRA